MPLSRISVELGENEAGCDAVAVLAALVAVNLAAGSSRTFEILVPNRLRGSRPILVYGRDFASLMRPQLECRGVATSLPDRQNQHRRLPESPRRALSRAKARARR